MDRPTSLPTRQRIPEWDILRTCAFTAVVLQHVLGSWARRPEIGQAGRLACAALFEPLRFAVPLFVFLFACGLFHSRSFSYGRYLKKRLGQLALPYVLWTVFYLLYRRVPLTPGNLVRSLIFGDGNYHLWYVVMILQFVVLAPLLLQLRRWLDRRWFVAVCLALWLAYLYLTPRCSSPGLLGAIFFRRRTLVFASWMGYFLLGACCGAYYDAFCRFARRALPVTALVYTGALAVGIWRSCRYVLTQQDITFSCMSLLGPVYALCILCAIACLYAIALRCGLWGGFARVCSWIGRHSYEAYLAHALLMNLGSMLLLHFLPTGPLWLFYLLLSLITWAGALAAGAGIDGIIALGKRLRKRILQKKEPIS